MLKCYEFQSSNYPFLNVTNEELYNKLSVILLLSSSRPAKHHGLITCSFTEASLRN
jgi:hypothetical protein